ncbi:MAG TPA: tyrosine-type recombinase/integrase [Longimicrobiaceae bacterium]
MGSKARYPGTIEQRGNGFRVSLRVAGERHRFTLANVSKKEAEAFARRKGEELEELARRQTLGLPDLIPFAGIGAEKCREQAPRGEDPVPAGFLDKYELDKVPDLAPNTRRSYAEILDRVRGFFNEHYPGLMIDEVRRAHIREYLTWRRSRLWRRGPNGSTVVVRGQCSNRTLQKERATLRAAMEYAVELELRESNPVAAVKPPKVVKRTPVLLNPDQYEALLRECEGDPMLWLYALTLGETGERCDSEALWMEWPDVRFDDGFLWVESGRNGRRTKSGKGRWVPMTPRLVAAMREHFARFRFATYNGKRTQWVFHHTRTRRHAKAGARIGSLRRAFKGAAKRAGLPEDLHQHDLRHRRATTWLAEGKDVVKVKEVLGHADLRTTMDYTHLAREHLRDLVDPTPTPPRRDVGT